MKQLLIVGAAILAQGPFTVTADEITAADAIYPKHVIEGWQIVDAVVPEGFTCAGCTWNGVAVVAKAAPPVAQAAIAAAIAKTYLDVDAVYDDAIGNRGTEYAEAEADARTFIAPGYTGVASAYVTDWALNNPTGVAQTDTWAANQIIARADAFRAAQLSMRSTRFARHTDMRAATTEAGLATAVAAWDGYIAALRVQLGL